eukprot:TRINITY_DN8287_c0_g1_i3.p2 TRINITY_DN8287_c0_g1~~TRINITY_DN8287_c0_g1_i3.p2  ORF type:complete len:136 (-),score=35.81 TRINITY_DN8287_c0_g1_i3:159-566(-)
MKERAKHTQKYKKAVKDAKINQSAANPKSGKKGKRREDSIPEPEIEVQVHGAEMPTWRSLFVLQLLYLPFIPFVFIYSLIKNRNAPKLSEEEKLRLKYGLSEEEFERLKEQQMYQYQQQMNSAKMKRYYRWMKKQ